MAESRGGHSATLALSERLNAGRSRHQVTHPTSYCESLTHLLKGNTGAGIFAMGYAFKNAGLLAASALTLLIGAICLYCDHILIRASICLKTKLGLELNLNFSETVEYSFETGPYSFKKCTKFVRVTVKLFIIVTQLGFCSIYFVLVSTELQDVLSGYGFNLSASIYMVIIYVPIMLFCLIRTLKFLTPVSLLSNLMLAFAIIATITISCFDLPDISTRKLVADITQFPIFFGTTIFAFEGIALILPLLNEMKKQDSFHSPLGVLNIGIVAVTLLFTVVGFIGYLKYGESVHGTITLDLPKDQVISDVIQLVLAIGILFTYPIQFYIANEVIWTDIDLAYGPVAHPLIYETLLRCGLVTVTRLDNESEVAPGGRSGSCSAGAQAGTLHIAHRRREQHSPRHGLPASLRHGAQMLSARRLPRREQVSRAQARARRYRPPRRLPRFRHGLLLQHRRHHR